MATNYPGALDTQQAVPAGTATLGGSTPTHTGAHQNHEDQINALETTLGVNPQGVGKVHTGISDTVGALLNKRGYLNLYGGTPNAYIGIGDGACNLTAAPHDTFAPTKGAVTYVRVEPDTSFTATRIYVAVNNASGTFTSFAAGLYSISGSTLTLMAGASVATVNTLASSNNSGIQLFTITGKALTAGTPYYVGILFSGGTGNPNLCGLSLPFSVLEIDPGTIGYGTQPDMAVTSPIGSGLTALPASATVNAPGATASTTFIPWVSLGV